MLSNYPKMQKSIGTKLYTFAQRIKEIVQFGKVEKANKDNS